MTFKLAYMIHLFIPAVIFSVFASVLILPKKRSLRIYYFHMLIFLVSQIINTYFIDSPFLNFIVCTIVSLAICYGLYYDSLKKRYQVVIVFMIIQLCAFMFTEIPLSFLYSIKLQAYEMFDREFTIYAASLYDLWLLVFSYYYIVQVASHKKSILLFQYMSLPICQFVFAYIIFLLCYDLSYYCVFIMLIVCLILISTNIMMLKSYRKLKLNYINQYETIKVGEMLKQEKELYDLKAELHQDVESIEVLLKKEFFIEANEYLKNKYKQLKMINIGSFCENKMVDIVLHHKIALMKEKNIDQRVNVYVRENIGVEDIDLVTLLFNILDNAIEACMEIDTRRYINIKMYEKYSCFYLEVINSKDPSVDHSHLKTTKMDTINHGIGISIIRNIVKKYKGKVIFEDNKETFRVKLFLKIDS